MKITKKWVIAIIVSVIILVNVVCGIILYINRDSNKLDELTILLSKSQDIYQENTVQNELGDVSVNTEELSFPEVKGLYIQKIKYEESSMESQTLGSLIFEDIVNWDQLDKISYLYPDTLLDGIESNKFTFKENIAEEDFFSADQYDTFGIGYEETDIQSSESLQTYLLTREKIKNMNILVFDTYAGSPIANKSRVLSILTDPEEKSSYLQNKQDSDLVIKEAQGRIEVPAITEKELIKNLTSNNNRVLLFDSSSSLSESVNSIFNIDESEYPNLSISYTASTLSYYFVDMDGQGTLLPVLLLDGNISNNDNSVTYNFQSYLPLIPDFEDLGINQILNVDNIDNSTIIKPQIDSYTLDNSKITIKGKVPKKIDCIDSNGRLVEQSKCKASELYLKTNACDYQELSQHGITCNTISNDLWNNIVYSDNYNFSTYIDLDITSDTTFMGDIYIYSCISYYPNGLPGGVICSEYSDLKLPVSIK